MTDSLCYHSPSKGKITDVILPPLRLLADPRSGGAISDDDFAAFCIVLFLTPMTTAKETMIEVSLLLLLPCGGRDRQLSSLLLKGAVQTWVDIDQRFARLYVNQTSCDKMKYYAIQFGLV